MVDEFFHVERDVEVHGLPEVVGEGAHDAVREAVYSAHRQVAVAMHDGAVEAFGHVLQGFGAHSRLQLAQQVGAHAFAVGVDGCRCHVVQLLEYAVLHLRRRLVCEGDGQDGAQRLAEAPLAKLESHLKVLFDKRVCLAGARRGFVYDEWSVCHDCGSFRGAKIRFFSDMQAVSPHFLSAAHAVYQPSTSRLLAVY